MRQPNENHQDRANAANNEYCGRAKLISAPACKSKTDWQQNPRAKRVNGIDTAKLFVGNHFLQCAVSHQAKYIETKSVNEHGGDQNRNRGFQAKE